MNGFSKSGKTHFVNKLIKAIPDKFVPIDSLTINKWLDKTYFPFVDDNTIEGPGYTLRNMATRAIQATLQNFLLENGFSVIDDSCNSTKLKRKKIADIAKNLSNKIPVVIVSIKISEETLLKRLSAEDNKSKNNGEKPHWVDQYNRVQKPVFEIPDSQEADFVFFVDNEREGSEEEVISALKKLLAIR